MNAMEVKIEEKNNKYPWMVDAWSLPPVTDRRKQPDNMQVN